MVQLTPDNRSLFLRLLTQRGQRDTDVRVKGHETWLTQAVGMVLQAEPGLARALVRSWCGIEVPDDAEIRVATEVSFALAAPDARTAVVDMVLTVPGAAVFIENKVDATLNTYLSVSEDKPNTISQVELYRRALERHRGSDAGFLMVLGKRRPVEDVPFKAWWDLHRLMTAYLARAPAEATPGLWLVAQLRSFLEEVHLDPPEALRSGAGFVVRHGQRLLAEAAEGLPARMSRSGYLTVEVPFGASGETRRHDVWFHQDSATDSPVVRAFRSGIGLLQVPPLGEGFWAAPVEEQEGFLRRLLQELGTLPAQDGARLTLAEALMRHETLGERAMEIADRISKRWSVRPSVGSNNRARPEVSFSLATGWSLRLRVTDRIADLIFMVGQDNLPQTRTGLEAVVGALPTQRNQHQVNLPLQLVQPEQIDDMLAVMDAVRAGIGVSNV